MDVPVAKTNSPSLIRRATAKFLRLQSRVSQKLLLPFASVPLVDRWIFIVGCYNSGTSLLSKVLASHPQVSGLPEEGIYFTDRLPFPEQFGWPRMWTECKDQVRLVPGDRSDRDIERIKRQWSLAFSKSSSNFVEKSVTNATRMTFLQEHFKPAYIISIVRNGYAVAEGIRRSANPASYGNPEYSGPYPIGQCAKQWRESDRLISEDAEKMERFLQVSYEDLTEDPATVFGRITEFLALSPFAPEALNRTWHVGNKEESIQNMNSRSFEALSEHDKDQIELVASETLSKYGYLRP